MDREDDIPIDAPLSVVLETYYEFEINVSLHSLWDAGWYMEIGHHDSPIHQQMFNWDTLDEVRVELINWFNERRKTSNKPPNCS